MARRLPRLHRFLTRSLSRPLSLTHQNALRLAVVFLAFELLAAVAVASLLMLPMARRAAGDLAGLIVLSAQTWSELPPATRPAFSLELTRGHQLVLAAAPPPSRQEAIWQGPYLRQLETELRKRIGPHTRLISAPLDGEAWHWVALPSGGRTLWVGFPHSRVGTQPIATLLVTLAAAFVMTLLGAVWLARHTVAPLRRFDAAASVLGRGETPELLPETGPRELAALARRFNTLARQVRDLLEARTTLLAGLSHDLRTPLARMRLTLEMMQRRPDPAWIARMDADVEEMNRLVGELLELARGLGKEKSAPVDLFDLLEELAGHERRAGAAVSVHAAPLTVDAPPAALRRILGNLLANARRYAAGTPLELRAEADDDGCRIGVLDRGPGIPEAQLEAVFRPFHRVEASRSAATGGTGLGLAIVRQLAQANGWRVSLENREGGGLAAWLEIPAQAARLQD
ncbi:MAG: ATP-binding protein [Pseudomonadota bacterium]